MLIQREQATELELRAGTLGPLRCSENEFEQDFGVGTPRRPFSERSARALYKALLDVEEAMNSEELRTLQLCQ